VHGALYLFASGLRNGMLWSPPSHAMSSQSRSSPIFFTIMAILRSLQGSSHLAMSGGELCPERERVRRKGGGKLGRKAGFCRGAEEASTRPCTMPHAPEPGWHDTATTDRFFFSTGVFAWSAGDVVSGGNRCERESACQRLEQR